MNVIIFKIEIIMTQEEKNLLLRDLCARLPYGVKLDTLEGPQELDTRWLAINMCNIASPYLPYLFPLSSMTKEQVEEYEDALTYHDYVKGGWTIAKNFEDEYIIPYWFVDFCNKHHLDYRGLIKKGLAIDATRLNIY